MGKTRISGVLGPNIFRQAFERFDEEEFFSKLHHRVRNKPYYERYLGFKNTVNILSYVFSVASALASAYAVYWLASWAGAPLWLSLGIGGVMLLFMEQIKRRASEEFWQVYFFEGRLPVGWLSLSLLLFALGVISSSFGAKEGAKDFAPPAVLMDSDSAATAYRERVAALEQENRRLARQKNGRGEIFWPAQRQMARNREIIAQYENRLLTRDEKQEGRNEILQAEHDGNVAFASRIFMLVQIFMELCFEGCIAYLWYFYFRSYVERRLLPAPPEEESAEPPAFHAVTPFAASPPPSGNGQPSAPPPIRDAVTAAVAGAPAPIGFFTAAQKARRGGEVGQARPVSVQTCTGLYRDETPSLYDDLYTVPHEYRRGGRVCLTPYTENQVLSRIGQYEREREQAIRQGLGEEVILNRRRWLDYWQTKRDELYRKQRAAGLR